jgi:glycosyltransferase involved in cell wall biosynthesis
VAYIGGLDTSKRVDRLVEILDALWLITPKLKCLIAGSGSDAHLLDAASQRGQVARIPYANASDKALISRVASCLLNPGRIGLIAVDALAMGLPIVTMPYAFHAPERDYLTEGVSLFVGPENASDHAQWLVDFVSTLEPARSWWFPTVTEMIQRFTDGVTQMLSSRRGRGSRHKTNQNN